MSALGHNRTLKHVGPPPTADIDERDWDVRFVPEGDILDLASPGLIS
jgi:hypothetical protein